MKRMWMWVGIALVVGVLIMAATRKGKDCGKAKKPLGPWSERTRQAYADYYGYDADIGPAPPGY